MTIGRGRCIAFVFARGGSKGLPGKNLREIGGISLLARAIECARACPSVSEVVVSTDSEVIAEEAENFGALVPSLRPSEYARDESPELDAWKHAISWFTDLNGDPNFDVFLSLPPTAPLRNPAIVEKCLATLDSSTDLVLTGVRSNRHPSFNMVQLNPRGLVTIAWNSENPPVRRQDTSILYDLATVAYVSTPGYVSSTHSLLSGRVRLVEVDRRIGIDIDDDFDLEVARMLLGGG